ncbi:hypothetical protein BD770DRAFT_382028, partial [Pilaira anomala]
MAFEFLEAGQYKVILGKSFDAKPKKKAPKYFNVKNKDNTDLRAYGNEAKLEKKKDRYQVEMKHTNSPNMIYDAEVSTEEEFNCILIYNEEKKTITLERQSAEIRLTRKKIETPQPNGRLNHSPLPVTYTPKTIHTPPITNTITEPVKEIITPVSPAVPATIVTPTITTPAKAAATVVVPEEDEFDLSKDLDEILDSDEEEEEEEEEEDIQAMTIDNDQDDDEDSESDQFEEIIAPTPIPPPTSNGVPSPMALPLNTSLPLSPNIPLSLALPGTPTATAVPAATSSASPSSSSAAAIKKRKFKMASAPIRHPGFISPMTSGTATAAAAAAAAAPVVQANKRPKLSGTPTTKEAGYSSSSGSEESSSGSESGSTESSSGESDSESGSGSGSSSDDDDFESLAQDISMSLSKGGASAPGSPLNQQQQRSPYKRSPYDMTPGNTPTPSTRLSAPSSSSNGAAGPMSLRALFNEEDEEEGLSSSSEDDD